MKKIHLLSGFLMLTVVATLFVACQKEQNGVSPQNGNASTSNENVRGVAVNGDGIVGMITGSAAQAMHNAYVNGNPGKTEYVVFDLKDIDGFLQMLKSKYKSDKVYVNFGVYDTNTAPVPSASGKTTVYFSGNDNRNQSGNVKSNGTVAPSADYLNHGGIWP